MMRIRRVVVSMSFLLESAAGEADAGRYRVAS
jgi:hypothetical protein